jgi:hypothetical protein
MKLRTYQKKKHTEEVGYLGKVLAHRCKCLLDEQKAVGKAILAINKTLKQTKDQKNSRATKVATAPVVEKQKRIIAETTKAILLVEADGSAVAFAEVFKQMRTDMQTVLQLMAQGKVGKETQVIEQDIAETLGDMISALEKTWGNQKGKNPSRRIEPGKPSKEMTKLTDLLEQIEEGYRMRVDNPLQAQQRYAIPLHSWDLEETKQN